MHHSPQYWPPQVTTFPSSKYPPASLPTLAWSTGKHDLTDQWMANRVHPRHHGRSKRSGLGWSSFGQTIFTQTQLTHAHFELYRSKIAAIQAVSLWKCYPKASLYLDLHHVQQFWFTQWPFLSQSQRCDMSPTSGQHELSSCDTDMLLSLNVESPCGHP